MPPALLTFEAAARELNVRRTNLNPVFALFSQIVPVFVPFLGPESAPTGANWPQLTPI